MNRFCVYYRSALCGLFRLILLSLIVTACATSGFDHRFWKVYSDPKDLYIKSMSSRHYGNHATPVLFTVANIGASLGMIVSNEVSGATLKDYSPTEYSKRLDEDVLETIKSVLGDSKKEAGIFLDGEAGLERNRFEINNQNEQLSSGNNEIDVAIEVFYTIDSGWLKPLSMEIEWHFLDGNGETLGTVKTKESSDKTDAVFPDTLDPKYEKIYIGLARESVKSLINLIGAQRNAFFSKAVSKNSAL